MLSRTTLLLLTTSILVWDFTKSGPEDAAVTRAGKESYRWARAEIAEMDLGRLAQEALDEITEPAPSASVDVEPDEAAPGPPAEPRIVLGGYSNGEVGDSVFSRRAIDQFIQEASARTGASAAFLSYLVERESDFNPVAGAGTSTARGLYQFIEHTWLDMFGRYGAQHDQADLAAYVSYTADGAPVVDDEAIRQRILDLRYDPKLSTFFAAAYALENREAMEAALGRPVVDSELYLAHFLGANGAVALIDAAENTPHVRAADLFPRAAEANHRYFYDGGRAVSAAELHETLLAPELMVASAAS